MIKYLTLFVLFLSFLIPSVTYSKGYDVETIGEYVMGDNDTKVEARKIALENAKLLAIEQIGTYLESETIVRDGKLSKDEIRTYTSGILKTSVISEDVSLLENKTTVFKIKIKSNVDIGILEQKIKEIKSDKQREKQINVLQDENVRLLKELERLSSQLRNINQTETKKLKSMRDDIFEKIEKNQDTIRMTFEKGMLIEVAKNTDEFLDNDKREVDNLFYFIKNRVKFKSSPPKVKLTGDKGEIVVDVNYEISKSDIESIVHRINEQFGSEIEYIGCILRNRIYICNSDYTFCNIPYKGYGFTGINGDDIVRYFTSKTLEFVLEVGSYRDTFVIGSGYSSIFLGKLDWNYEINTNTLNKLYTLRIIDVPKEILSNVDEINFGLSVGHKEPNKLIRPKN